MMVTLTLLAIAIVIYHHAVYPLLLKLGSRLAQRPEPALQPEPWPRITIIVPAYNEARWIADKIVNLACLDYPEDRLDIVIACDGCTDETAGIARETVASLGLEDQVRVCDYRTNRGKLALLNAEIELARSGIVALSDVSALLSIDALKLTARHFADPHVGVVVASYMLAKAGTAGEQAYWRFQSRLREEEARIAGAIGASGGFFAIRRDLFTPLPADTINDDFVLPMQIVEKGYRAALEPDIHAVELEPSGLVADWRRRQRIGAGNFQQSLRLWRLLSPKRPSLAFVFLSGKWLRPVQPFVMLAAFMGSAILAMESHFFFLAFVGQATAYSLALLVQIRPRAAWLGLSRKLHYLVIGHVAALVGICRYLVGQDGLRPGNSRM